MAASGIIFSNIHDDHIPELTQLRTIASVPFACRYRFIDFALSNMVNSDIYNISVITSYNYQSLVDHIGSGKDWDLARRGGGVKILPPFITSFANQMTPANQNTRLEALKGAIDSLMRMTDEYVVLSDCDVICNIDLNAMITAHKESGADITLAVKNVQLNRETASKNVLYQSDADGRVTDVMSYPNDYEGEGDISLNILVMKTSYLRQIVVDAITHNYTSLTRDVILRNMNRKEYRIYRVEGYFACMSSFEDYYSCSMDLLTSPTAYASLFQERNRPVYTKVRNSIPAYYSPASSVKNSLIADGCVIEGSVENSIIFRGVKIGKNATVKNSIIMQDTIVSEGSFLNHVITDKNAVIGESRMLCGAQEQPYYVPKGKRL